jgi:hypothetical protein
MPEISDRPGSVFYRGPSPLSEPEVAAMYRTLRFTFSTPDTSLLIPKRMKLRPL